MATLLDQISDIFSGRLSKAEVALRKSEALLNEATHTIAKMKDAHVEASLEIQHLHEEMKARESRNAGHAVRDFHEAVQQAPPMKLPSVTKGKRGRTMPDKRAPKLRGE